MSAGHTPGPESEISHALDCLNSSHVSPNLFRLGALGSNDVNRAVSFLQTALNKAKADSQLKAQLLDAVRTFQIFCQAEGGKDRLEAKLEALILKAEGGGK